MVMGKERTALEKLAAPLWERASLAEAPVGHSRVSAQSSETNRKPKPPPVQAGTLDSPLGLAERGGDEALEHRWPGGLRG